MKPLLALLFTLPALAQEASWQGTLGTRGSYLTGGDGWDNQLNYAEFSWQNQAFTEDASSKRTVSLRVFDPVSSDEPPVIDPVNVSLERLAGPWTFQVGFLRYRFSETFGFQILDVANPRDYGDYLLNDLGWAKRSVFGGNLQWNSGPWQLQGILTLWGNGDRLPWRGSAYDVVPETVEYEGGVVDRPWFKDPEYGARLKHLFANGLDVGLLYYHHFSRPTLLEIASTGPLTFKARPTEVQVSSWGASFSQVLGDWVVRGDGLLTEDDPVPRTGLKTTRREHLQYLVGVDRTWDEWLFGIQYQDDREFERPTAGGRLEWQKYGAWKPSVMCFVGERSDSWVQLRQRLEWEEWRAELTVDALNGKNDGRTLFGALKDQDRVLVDVGRSF